MEFTLNEYHRDIPNEELLEDLLRVANLLKSDRLSRFADDLIDSIVSADAIFPTRPEDLKLRRLYQDKARVP